MSIHFDVQIHWYWFKDQDLRHATVEKVMAKLFTDFIRLRVKSLFYLSVLS